MFKLRTTLGIAALLVALPALGGEAPQKLKPDPRKFPLERCDQLDVKARTACLEKARVEILEARRQRAAAAEAAKAKGKGEGRP